MQMPEFLAQYTGQPAASLVGRWSIRADLDGSYKVTKWSVQGINAPTSAEIIAGLAQADPVSHLAGVLVAKASAACDAITAQVLTAQTHTAGYTNAAAWATAALLVDPSDGGVPTADPGKTAFTNMAAANGFKTPAAFATLVLTLSASVMALSAILTTLTNAARSSSATAASLAAALTAFETSLASEVASLTSAGLTITAPAALSIAGINA